jgi:hypothetical protein
VGWAVLFLVFVITGGQTLWTGYLGMAMGFGNFLAYDRNRSTPPAPARPQDSAFKAPVFAAAAIGLVASGIMVLLILASVMPAPCLGPFCRASGFTWVVLVLAMARWQIRPDRRIHFGFAITL